MKARQNQGLPMDFSRTAANSIHNHTGVQGFPLQLGQGFQGLAPKWHQEPGFLRTDLKAGPGASHGEWAGDSDERHGGMARTSDSESQRASKQLSCPTFRPMNPDHKLAEWMQPNACMQCHEYGQIGTVCGEQKWRKKQYHDGQEREIVLSMMVHSPAITLYYTPSMMGNVHSNVFSGPVWEIPCCTEFMPNSMCLHLNGQCSVPAPASLESLLCYRNFSF